MPRFISANWFVVCHLVVALFRVYFREACKWLGPWYPCDRLALVALPLTNFFFLYYCDNDKKSAQTLVQFCLPNATAVSLPSELNEYMRGDVLPKRSCTHFLPRFKFRSFLSVDWYTVLRQSAFELQIEFSWPRETFTIIRTVLAHKILGAKPLLN